MGVRRGEIFLAPPYYSQRAEFASPSAFFSVTVLGASKEDLSLLMRISNFLAQFLID